jgi:hypothetical protein
MKVTAFWDITPYSLIEVGQHSEVRIAFIIRAMVEAVCTSEMSVYFNKTSKSKAVPLHAMEALGGRGGIAPTHSQPRH